MKSRSGMTLLEVIVALAVAGAALLAGTSVLAFLTDRDGRETTQAVASAYAMRTQVREWIAGAHLATQGDAEFRGGPAGVRVSGPVMSSSLDDPGNDELWFVTSTPTDVSRTGTVVHLYLEHGTHGLMASLTPYRAAGPSLVIPLAPAATGFRTRFLGSTDSPAWDRQWASTAVLPAGVDVRVDFAPSDDAAQALASVPIRVALGSRP